MITKEPYFKVICDECEEAFPEHETGSGFTLFETEQQAREEVVDCDGEITEDGKTYCSTCVEDRQQQKEKP